MKRTAILIMISVITYCGKDYGGGTLISANGLRWQDGTYDNKLKTCYDYASYYFAKNMFTDEVTAAIKISDREEMLRAIAVRFVDFLDKAFVRDADLEKNKQKYQNVTVEGTLLIGAKLMGYLK